MTSIYLRNLREHRALFESLASLAAEGEGSDAWQIPVRAMQYTRVELMELMQHVARLPTEQREVLHPEEHLPVGSQDFMQDCRRLGYESGSIDPVPVIPQGPLQRSMKENDGRRLPVAFEFQPQPRQLFVGQTCQVIHVIRREKNQQVFTYLPAVIQTCQAKCMAEPTKLFLLGGLSACDQHVLRTVMIGVDVVVIAGYYHQWFVQPRKKTLRCFVFTFGAEIGADIAHCHHHLDILPGIDGGDGLLFDLDTSPGQVRIAKNDQMVIRPVSSPSSSSTAVLRKTSRSLESQ